MVTTPVTTWGEALLTSLAAALALALGLAFGLGGRDTAAEIAQTWYRRGQQSAPRLARAADAAQRRTEQGVGDGPGDRIPVSSGRMTQDRPIPGRETQND